MRYEFPEGFLWGTSTSALQIETAGPHDWRGLKGEDGSILERTIAHDLCMKEDAEIISSLGNAYRFSMDWSKIQERPYSQLNPDVVESYRDFIGSLKDKGTKIMLVLHHFANPAWFTEGGSWKDAESIDVFNDYSQRIASDFGDLVDIWNTINEPNVYAGLSHISGEFPPHKRRRLLSAYKILCNMGSAHEASYRSIKEVSETPVGATMNTMDFYGDSLLGKIGADVVDLVSVDFTSSKFSNCDFFGINYYGKILFDPLPVMAIDSSERLDEKGLEHDKMFQYHPSGLADVLMRFHKKYGKPLFVTENGCCTDDDEQRKRSIRDHLISAHDVLSRGVDLRGYFHWSTFDNFELHLGMSYRFGLVDVDLKTMTREPKPSAAYYSKIAKNNLLEDFEKDF